MIYDTLSHLARYRGLSHALDCAITYLTHTDLHALPQGRTEIVGDSVYINHFSYETSAKEPDSLFEAHSAYLDLHIVLSGCERMAVAPIDTLAYAEDRSDEDSIMYTGDAQYLLPLCYGQFALLAPEEAHLPHLLVDAPCIVDKLVCKIRT